VPKGDESKILLGEPADVSVDVGAAVRKGEDVVVNVYSGTSVLDAGSPTGETAVIGRILSPLARKEVGTIRCIGLNVSIRPAWLGARRGLLLSSPRWGEVLTDGEQYKKHAEEAKMSIPEIPTLFLYVASVPMPRP
jgi:hypothetical protein